MIIFLSGSKDAGKTTTAKLLQQMDPTIAIVEPDVYFPLLPPQMELFEQARHCVQMSALCIRYLHRSKFTVIVPYPISNEDHDTFLQLLSDVPERKIHFVTLLPEKDVILNRVGATDPRTGDQLFRKEVIEQQYRSVWGVGTVKPAYETHVIDNSALTPRETARELYSHIERLKQGQIARQAAWR